MSGSEAPKTGKRGRRGAGRAIRLRRWLLGSAVLLVALLAALIGYARHRARAALLDLPHLLGADIKSETDGYTYSQTVKGRTLFTLHAAKAIQHRDGKTTLHDVSVTLYGEPGTDRVDRIRGAQFEYDQSTGIVRALGESEIDLASPSDAADRPEARRIHVLANGLVFEQKAGTAHTDDAIHFQYGDMRGSAVGADFNAHTGLLHLQHAVHVAGEQKGTMQQVDADTAVLDRQQRTALLTRATVVQAGQSLHADNLLLRLRPEAPGSSTSIDTVRGTGGVQVRATNGDTATAPSLDVTVTPDNHLHQASLTGGVTLHGEQGDGHSGTAVLYFDDRGRPSRVQLAHAVDLHQASSEGNKRQLTADAAEGTLGTDAAGRTVLQQSTATGHAILSLSDPATAAKASKQTTLTADVLHAYGAPVANRWQLSRVAGDGATRVEEHTAALSRVSTAEHTMILLGPDHGTVTSFTQQGRVHAVSRQAATPGKAAAESIADADRAEYLAGAGTITLTGSPMVRSDSMQVAANRIAIATATGDADATGSVQGSARTQGSAEQGTLHFIADHVMTDRATRQATLSSTAGLVRLWNATSQIEAPEMELDQAKGTLYAHGAPGSHSNSAVRSILPANAQPGAAAPQNPAGSMRILSETLRYHQASGAAPATALFSGGVRLDTTSGQVQCDTATAVLRQGSKSDAMLGGAVDTVTAEGRVRVVQPGRSAFGTRLVYTAASQQFVLTGAPGALPSVRDSVRGTVNGSALLFRAGDDSVEVTGAPDQPVRTELDAPPRTTTNRGKPGAAAARPTLSRTK